MTRERVRARVHELQRLREQELDGVRVHVHVRIRELYEQDNTCLTYDECT